MIHDTSEVFRLLANLTRMKRLTKVCNIDKPAVIEMRQWARRKGRKK